jgi:tetratricopeptide (TPR) repeat protein
MPPPRFFRLQVADLTGSGRFNLRLWNETDQLLATHVVQVPEVGPALIRWRGLLALDDYLEVEQGRGRSADALMIELGDFLTQQVLGEPLAAHLFQRQRLGTLFVELPVERRPEALELTRIPWELTRYAGKWLADAGLGVQIVPQALLPPGPQLADALQAIQPFDPGGPLRVLLIFSLARGTTALAMREEREQLTSFFLGELASAYQVQVDLLQYGVTRVALEEAASQQGGYHLIHFSGHGVEHTAIGSDGRQQTRLGLLLERDDGGPDAITGEEFADIFRRNGDPPHLVFLSACHSGELGERWQLAALWQDLRRRSDRDSATREMPEALTAPPGSTYTGVALSLLRAEVGTVVAMRYAVGDDFAREAALRFYRRTLRDSNPPARALAQVMDQARRSRGPGDRAHDWVVPVLFGQVAAQAPIALHRGRSRQADQLAVAGKLPLTLRRPPRCVGRSDQLRALRHALLSPDGQPLTLLWGIGGLGKTTLAAEAIHLWHAHFECVHGVQPPGPQQPFALESWLQELDYLAATVAQDVTSRIWLARRADETAEQWLERRIDALVTLLNRHRWLLVLDSMESNLWREGEDSADDPGPRCTFQDPRWGLVLQALAQRLESHGARVLLTSRLAPAELLAEPGCRKLPLGPLPAAEWLLFARSPDNPNLRRLCYATDEAERQLLWRLLQAARGHPYLLATLERLAADPTRLRAALEEFEAAGGRYGDLGDVLTQDLPPEVRTRELAYVEDITGRGVASLLAGLSAGAQRLLRVVTLALEPVTERLIACVWEDDLWSVEAFRRLDERWSAEAFPRLQEGIDWQAPLEELSTAGLLTAQQEGEGTAVAYTWHPIVAEQASVHLPAPPFPEGAYLQRYALFHGLTFRGFRECARSRDDVEFALKNVRLAIRYLVHAGDWENAAGIIHNIHRMSAAPDFLREVETWVVGLLPEVPQGNLREALLCTLANIYRDEERLSEAIPLYRETLASTEARQDWRNSSTISYQLGIGLRNAADYPAARAAYRLALQYERRAGRRFTGRHDILQQLVILILDEGGEKEWRRASKHASRLVSLARAYYQRVQADPSAAEAEPAESAEDLLIDALKVQNYAEFRLHDYTAMLHTCTGLIELRQRDHRSDLSLARELVNRAVCLTQLGQRDKAEDDLRHCRRIFHDYQDFVGEINVLGKLASLADDDCDPTRAVEFARQALTLCHRLGAGGLSYSVLSHYNLAVYQTQLAVCLKIRGLLLEAVFEAACAMLIGTLIGEKSRVADSLANLRIWLQLLSSDQRRAAWPTAAAIWETYPELACTLAEREVTAAMAQVILDSRWDELAKVPSHQAGS